MIKTGHIDYTGHLTFVVAREKHSVIGLDIHDRVREFEECVQVFRFGRELGWLVIYQDLEKKRKRDIRLDRCEREEFTQVGDAGES